MNIDEERFNYLYDLLPWNVKPEDKEAWDEVHRIAGIAVRKEFENIFETHRQLLDSEALRSEVEGGFNKR
jgi:hypothetical protein